jgi:serine/threonine protein kinase/WD40 repeat protein
MGERSANSRRSADQKNQQPPSTVASPGRTEASNAPRGAEGPVKGRVGRFQLRALLGQGAFGKVYRAFDPRLEREVAIKLPKFGADDRELVDRFLREARTVARLRHPNIVTVFDIGKEGTETFIASELIEGKTLGDLLREERPSLRRAVGWVKDLALALAYAHGQGVVHRDIKPGNIMIDVHGRPLLMDFGLAKSAGAIDPAVASQVLPAGADALMTQDGVVIGTPAYMAPEQARGESRKVGPRSDQYSLAVVLFRLLTGRLPYIGTAFDVLERTANKKLRVPAPRTFNPDIPADLDAVCRKALSKSPGARYPGAEEFALDLQRWLADEPVKARPRSRGERLSRWARKHVAWLTAASLVSAMLLVTLAVLLNRPRSTSAVSASKEATAGEPRSTSAQAPAQLSSAERQLLVSKCRQYREQGLRLCNDQHAEAGVHFLARALRLAHELHDKNDRLLPLDWEAGTERELASWAQRLLPLRDVVPHDAEIDQTSWAVCPDGSAIIAVKNHTQVRVFAPESGALLVGPFTFPDVVDAVGISRDRRRLWAKGVSSPIRVWNLSDGKEVRAVTHYGGVNRAVALSPDGQELITGGYDGQVVVWDLATGKKASEQRFYDATVARLSLSPTEYLIVTGGQDGIIRRFDRAKGMHRDPVLSVRGQVNALYFSPDGRRLAATYYNGAAGRGEAAIFDPRTGQVVKNTPFHKTGISCFAFGPGELSATGGISDHRARLWSTDKADHVFEMTHQGEVTTVAFTHGGQHLITGTGTQSLNVFHHTNSSANNNLDVKNALHLWDVNTGRAVGHGLQQQSLVADLALTPGGTTLLSTDGPVVRLWDLHALSGIGPPLSLSEAVSAIAFTSDGARLLTGGVDKTVRIWDLAARKELKSAPIAPGNLVQIVGFSPDGKRFLAASENNTVRIYDAVTLDPITAALKHPDSTYIAACAFGPDQHIRTVTVGGSVWTWNGKEAVSGKIPSGFFLAMSADGRLAATRGKESVDLWDLSTMATAGSIPLKYHMMDGAAFSPDGKFLVICTSTHVSEHHLVVVDLPARQKRGEPISIGSLTSYLQHIRRMSVGSDLETLWVQGDQAARKYSLRTGKALGLPIIHEPGLRCIAFTTDGRTVATGGQDGSIQFWNPLPNIPYSDDTIERWLEMATGLTMGKEGEVVLLTPKEWTQKRLDVERLTKDVDKELARRAP